MASWINIKDRQPADGEFFLGYGPGMGNYIGGPEMDICRMWADSVWDEGGTELSFGRMTHWMPLPGQPEEPNG